MKIRYLPRFTKILRCGIKSHTSFFQTLSQFANFLCFSPLYYAILCVDTSRASAPYYRTPSFFRVRYKREGLMKISTEIASAAALVGEEKAVEYTAKAGFDAWDFSMFDMCKYDWSAGCFLPNDNPLASDNYLAFARRLKQIGLDNGILCNQSHAPFPSRGPIIPYLKRALECTAEAGGKICIIHPDNYLSAQENAEMYFDLLPFAKECGVKIATENMWGWDNEKDQSSFAACATSASFNEHLDVVNDDFFVACLDIGHAEMRGSGEGAANMIRALGNRQIGRAHV